MPRDQHSTNTWTMSGRDRADFLWKVGDLLEQRAEELVSLEPIDMGKP